jgi:hypothetical protein
MTHAIADRSVLAPIALLVGLFTACQASEPPPPPRPPYQPTATCADACTHLRALPCPAGEPTSRGTTCEAICADVNASGMARWPADCVVVARSCAEAKACR